MFTPSMEEKAIRLSQRTRVLSIVKTVLYWLAVVAVWFGYCHLWERPLTDPSAIAFTILLVIPFCWPKIQNRWFEKGWHGTVVRIRDIEELPINTRFRMREMRTNLEITFRTSEGNEVLVFKEGEDYKIAANYYHMDDRVWKLPCLKFPIDLEDAEKRAEDVFCPKCGRFNKIEKKRCRWCHAPIMREDSTIGVIHKD